MNKYKHRYEVRRNEWVYTFRCTLIGLCKCVFVKVFSEWNLSPIQPHRAKIGICRKQTWMTNQHCEWFLVLKDLHQSIEFPTEEKYSWRQEMFNVILTCKNRQLPSILEEPLNMKAKNENTRQYSHNNKS